VEFTYNKRLRQQITELNKNIEGQMLSINNRQYSVPLTEKNLHQVVNVFKPQGFSIDPLIMKFYEEISEIYEKSSNQFDVFNLSNNVIPSSVIQDTIIQDKSIEDSINQLKSLNEYISNGHNASAAH
jgi:hypothetical protein